MQQLALLQTTLREPPHLLPCVVLASDEKVEIPLTLPIQTLYITRPIRFMDSGCRRFHGLLTHVLCLVGGTLNAVNLTLQTPSLDRPWSTKRITFAQLLFSSKFLFQ